MKKGRSNYSFNINCDVDIIENLIQSYLVANEFKLIKKGNEQFYRAGDIILEGYRGFAYNIVGQTLQISVWFLGIFGGQYPIEKKIPNVNMINYRNSLSVLFKELEKINI